MSIYDSMTEQQELTFLRQILGNMDQAKTASETSSVPQKTPSPEALARLKEKIKDGRWTGGTNSDGYPKVKIDSQSELASHVLLKSLGRGLKPGQVVMHLNNDKLDMDPAHLRVGTQQQNLKQMRDEGRDRPRGVDQEPDMKKKADELDRKFVEGIKPDFLRAPGVTRHQMQAIGKRMGGMDPLSVYQISHMDAAAKGIPVTHAVHQQAMNLGIPYPHHLGAGGRQPLQQFGDDILEGLGPRPTPPPLPKPDVSHIPEAAQLKPGGGAAASSRVHYPHPTLSCGGGPERSPSVCCHPSSASSPPDSPDLEEGGLMFMKTGELKTELLPHQRRVVERMKEPDRKGLVVIHGLGSGKCVRGGTPIYTDKGLLPIRDLFVEPWPDAGDRVLPPGDVQVLSLVGSELRWCNLRARYIQRLSEEEATRVVVTGRGNRVEVTAAHPLLKLVEGAPAWTPAADVKEGDWLIFPSAIPGVPSPKEADLSLVHFLCWLAAEGWEYPGKPGTGTITQKDESVLLPLQQYLRQKTASVANIHRKEGRASWLSFSSKSLGQDLASEGYTWGNLSKDKQLPAWLLACSDAVVDLALATLWSAEGSVSSACAEMTLASPVLLDQVKYLLLRRGGRSSLRSKEAMATNGHRIKRTYWRTLVSGADLGALDLEELSAQKRSRLDELVNKTRNPNTGVPCGWLYELLRPAGVVPKMLGVSPNKSRSFSIDTAHKVCERLRSWSAEGAAEAQSRVVKSSGGPARMYAERLLRVMQHPALLRNALKKLEYLISAPFRFEEVELVADGERGGYVFDVEVDSDVYDHKNWVGGSGGWFLHNTLTSIAAQDALGTPATVVVPAALQENYRKEQAKHLKGKPEKTHIETLQRVALEGGAHPSPLTIFDEAHRLRDHTSASFQAAKQPGTDKRLLLTGSPFYNDPSDIAPLVNLAANRKVLPMGKEEFGSRYVGLKKVSPGFIQEHFMGIQPGEVPVLNERRADELRKIFAEHTDFHPGSTDNFPRVDRRDVVVPMSKEQKEVYDTLMGQAPSWVAKKVKAGLPPSKQEMQSMGAFLTAPRQAVNSTSPYVKDEAAAQSPKIQKAFENLQALMKENPNAKAVIYSNFLDAGINPYKKLLEGAGIAHGEFTGSQNAKARDQMVKDYNEGKLKALLLSSAGGEGLDLKGTRLVQMLEPHWNEEKLKQVEGRAARYGSHSHLTPEEQQVLVERYLSGIEPGIVQKIKSKLFGSKPDQSVDQYLAMMSKDKENLNKQFRDLLPRHEKTAAPRWIKEVRKGFIGVPEVNKIIGKNVPGHNLYEWGLETPVNPERLTAHLQGRPFEVPELPAGTVPGRLPRVAEGWVVDKPAAPTPSEGLLSVSERAALRDPNSTEVFAPGSPYPRTYPEEVKKNPLYDLQVLMDPGLKEEVEEATRGGLRHLRKEMGRVDPPLAQLSVNQRKRLVKDSRTDRELEQFWQDSDARLKVLREQAASLEQQMTAKPTEAVQTSDRPFPWKPVLGATAAVAAPAAAYVAYDHLKNKSEKQAEEEPSALRSHLLHGLGYALPIQASFGALPLALRLQGVPHSGKFLAASQLVAAPLSYLTMKGHGERQEAEAKRQAKAVAKNARKTPELEENAELSGLSLAGRALKSGGKGVLSGLMAGTASGVPVLATEAHGGDPAAGMRATLLHTALSAPAHLIGGLARTLEDRDTARMALSRLGAAQKDQDLSDGRKLVRLKKQVAKLEGKLSDEL